MSKNTPKTEQIFKKSKPIDHLSSAEAISLMIEEQQNASIEVKKSANSIEIAVEAIHSNLIKNPNGRLVYVGAGTSGRIGVQDGVELFPTFNWPKKRLEFIIAGGDKAILKAVENAEDDVLEAKRLYQKMYKF